MDRRQFVGICAASAAALSTHSWHALAAGVQEFPAVKLVDAQGVPLKAATLATHQAYLFNYPFRAVPCFLINLGKPSAKAQLLSGESGSYEWPGGAGAQHNLVSYIAICTHQMSYPNKATSVIRYAGDGSELAEKPGMIVCCAHGSVFDPAAGAVKVSGPAEQPLIPVRLEVDPLDDSISATGVAANELIERFFQAYKVDFIAEYGPGGYRQPVEASARTVLLDQFSKTVTNC
ncbi:MAG: Rieske (2Fe-2S) protein [Xanthomonadales bacterium]|nr:Rieske (2Fe-2S) protein [Xanthomonadales bacterium]